MTMTTAVRTVPLASSASLVDEFYSEARVDTLNAELARRALLSALKDRI